MTWKQAARKFRTRWRNTEHNYREMVRDNLDARKALDRFAAAWMVQIQREAGHTHLSQEAMRALMDEVFVNAKRVLNGGRGDNSDLWLARELEIIQDEAIEMSGYPGGTSATIAFAFGGLMERLSRLEARLRG